MTVAERVTAATITSDRPLPYQVDGDHLGEADRFDLRLEPDALTLVVP